MEKLDLPLWYTCASKTVSNKYDKRMSPSTSTQTSLKSSWRTNSMTSKTSWRRKQATSFSRTSTLERSSSVEHNANSMKSQNDVKHVYLGWRSQVLMSSRVYIKELNLLVKCYWLVDHHCCRNSCNKGRVKKKIWIYSYLGG